MFIFDELAFFILVSKYTLSLMCFWNGVHIVWIKANEIKDSGDKMVKEFCVELLVYCPAVTL